jgi:lipid A 3-O-deacylase
MNLKNYHLLLLLLFFIPIKSEGQDFLKNDSEYTAYVGTFDTIDKEGDDKATLYGIEHNNPILFRDTFVGKFSPITGGFITDKNSIYLYTGVQAQYEVGPLNIIPSFAPGYYDPGDGKKLGSVLEFKSEIKLSFDIFKDSKIGYSYGHISNNNWGDINPGVDNKQILFSKSF